jgi:hypothetical protein
MGSRMVGLIPEGLEAAVRKKLYGKPNRIVSRIDNLIFTTTLYSGEKLQGASGTECTEEVFGHRIF